MNNIKTIEVVKPLTGLEVGDVLTRNDSNSNFELDIEVAGDLLGVPYTAQRFISLSASLLNIDEFKPIEYFEDPEPRKKFKLGDYAVKLEEQIDELSESVMFHNKENYELKKVISALKDDLASEMKCTSNLKENLDRLYNRVDEKLKEYTEKELQYKEELEDRFISGERVEWADEALTVYTNMIDLLKKLVA
jgi:chromosome segregation ATPase